MKLFGSKGGYHHIIQQNPIRSISPIKIGIFITLRSSEGSRDLLASGGNFGGITGNRHLNVLKNSTSSVLNAVVQSSPNLLVKDVAHELPQSGGN